MLASAAQGQPSYLEKAAQWRRELQRAEHDSVRIVRYQQLSQIYERRDIDSASRYADQAYALAQRAGDSVWLATSLAQCAHVLYSQARTDSALVLARQARDLLAKADAPRLSAKHLSYLGDYYQRKAQYADALSYYRQAILLHRQTHDSTALVITLGNLGLLHARTKKYDEALRLTERSYALAEALQDPGSLMEAATDLGGAHIYLRNDSLALVFCQRGLAWAEQLGDLKKQAYNLNNIAQVYQHQRQYQAAIPYYQRALRLKKKLGDEDAVVRSYFGLAGCYKRLRQYERSRHYYTEGLALARQNDFFYGEMLFHYSLSDLDSITGNITDALGHMHRYVALKDSILSLEKAKEIEELQARYEAEAREQKIALLQRENALKMMEAQRQSYLKNAFIGVFVLLVALLGVLYSRYRLKKKSLRITAAQKQEIEQRNQKIEVKNRENEILLREIHHRVKNNLQIILSLLNIQSRRFKDQAVLDFIQEGQSRVRSMALIHQDLYRADRLDRVVFSEYLTKLLSYLKTIYSAERRQITTHLCTDSVSLDVNTAIPLGLIVNELVSNALKHAFRDGQTGQVVVELKKEDRFYQLWVSDNGTGLPADLEEQIARSMGLKLVYGLVEQLHGSVDVQTERGSTFKITFSHPPLYPQRYGTS